VETIVGWGVTSDGGDLPKTLARRASERAAPAAGVD
jgi:hypothetical protein